MMEGAVFVQTNEPENAVIAFGRTAEGELSRLEAYRTGGAGEGEPHLPSQGSVVLTGDGRHLLVTNAASDDVSLFAVADESRLELLGPTPAGTRPRSVAEHDGLVYVLATGVPSVSGFRLTGNGLDLFDESNHPLEAGADPAQVGFSADGSTLVVSLRGTDSIVAFAVQPDGGLGSPQPVPSSGPTPYGFGFTGGGTLVVTEAFRAEKGAAAASSYAVQGASVTPVTKSVANGRSEIC